MTIARYNLWTSELPIYDIDPSPVLSMVDTEFGRLGFAICEDLLWRSPVVELVEEGGIDTLLLPLSWWDMFPHQLAHSNEDAWARGLQVNSASFSASHNLTALPLPLFLLRF